MGIAILLFIEVLDFVDMVKLLFMTLMTQYWNYLTLKQDLI